MLLTNDARTIYTVDPAQGWAALAEKGIELHSVAGDNLSMFSPPHVEQLAEKLKSLLAQAQANCQK
jgi:thioesterase domain-containing protein